MPLGRWTVGLLPYAAGVRSDGRPWDELVRELKAVHKDIQDHAVFGHTPGR